jgi:hypothetical protein
MAANCWFQAMVIRKTWALEEHGRRWEWNSRLIIDKDGI